MKKTARKLALTRLSLATLGRAAGAYRCVSYDAGCSNSCNTCDPGNWLCYVIDETDLCTDHCTQNCPTAMPSMQC